MNLSEYREAVIEGFRSIVGAVVHWRENALTTKVNRRLWGPWPWLSLGALTATALSLDLLLPPFENLIGLFPPLMALAFIPGIVRNLLYSAPAVFAIVVVWRVRTLRGTSDESWPERRDLAHFGARFFDAGALPIAAAALVLAIGAAVVDKPGIPTPTPEAVEAVTDHLPTVTMSWSANRVARNLVIVALIAGILGVHRTIGKGLGKLLGAGFAVFGMHLGVGFAIPWMVSWWSYLPFVGQFAQQKSPGAVHLLVDLAIALTAWAAARGKCREAPLWSDELKPPPPPPPPPTAVTDHQ